MANYLYSSYQEFIRSPVKNNLMTIPCMTREIEKELKSKNVNINTLFGTFLIMNKDVEKFADYLNTFPTIKKENISKKISKAFHYKVSVMFGDLKDL